MAKQKSGASVAKKLLMVFGGLFVLMLLAAIIVPLVVDVDKYRPTIVSKVNERIDGKLELGHLDLSLWGRVHIDIDGLKLTDAAGRTVVDVKDASFNMPLLSLLTGSPRLRLAMDEPTINLVKQRNGKINAMTLMKQEPGAGGAGAGKPGAAGAPATKGETEVPGIVMNSRFTVLLTDAKFSYKDEVTGDSYKIDDLNLRIEDVSPSGTMPFEISADLDLLAQKKIKVTGPVVLQGNVKADSSGGELRRANVAASLELDGAEIIYPGVINKAKGVALGAELKANFADDSFGTEKMFFKLADVTIDGSLTGKTTGDVTTVDFKAQSNKIDIEKLGKLSPLVKEYNLNGLVEIAVNAQGPTSNLGYGANVKFNKISLNHESMKQPLEVNGALVVATNQIQNLTMKLGAKEFDLNVNGSLQNFTAPRFKFSVVSNKMNLDELLKASAKAAEERREQAKVETSPGGAANDKAVANVVDYNAMFKPLRESPVAARAAGTVDFNLKSVKSTGIVISDVKGQMALSNLLMQLKDFSMGIFGGQIKGGMSFNAKAAKPEVATNIAVINVDTQKAAAQSMPIARNSIKGVIGAALNIGGPGVNMSDIITNWKGGGNMDIREAHFKTLEIGRAIRDGALTKLPEPLRGKIRVPDKVIDHQGKYEVVGMRFGLNNGILNITDINGKAYPNQGLDLKGGGEVRMADYKLDLTLDIIDTYDLLNADKIAKDSRYGHFTLSPKVGGTLFEPKFDWGATIGKLAENAARQQAKEAIQKNVGKLPGGLGKIFGGDKKEGEQKQEQKPADAVKGALKGIFGR